MQSASVQKEVSENPPATEQGQPAPAPAPEAPRMTAAPAPALAPVHVPAPAPTPALKATRGRLAPGFAAKLNLLVDLLLVVGALLGSTLLMGHKIQVSNLDFWALLGMAGL